MEQCKICGKAFKDDEVQCRLLGEKGKYLCEDCAGIIYVANKTKVKSEYEDKLRKIEYLLKTNSANEETRIFINNMIEKREFKDIVPTKETKGKSFWASLIKTISVIVLILFIAVGAIIGNGFAKFSDDKFLYVLIGAVLGSLIGTVIVALILFAVEIAQNISKGVDLLNSINRKLDKEN